MAKFRIALSKTKEEERKGMRDDKYFGRHIPSRIQSIPDAPTEKWLTKSMERIKSQQIPYEQIEKETEEYLIRVKNYYLEKERKKKEYDARAREQWRLQKLPENTFAIDYAYDYTKDTKDRLKKYRRLDQQTLRKIRDKLLETPTSKLPLGPDVKNEALIWLQSLIDQKNN